MGMAVFEECLDHLCCGCPVWEEEEAAAYLK
jgi:hypothetical protein